MNSLPTFCFVRENSNSVYDFDTGLDVGTVEVVGPRPNGGDYLEVTLLSGKVVPAYRVDVDFNICERV